MKKKVGYLFPEGRPRRWWEVGGGEAELYSFITSTLDGVERSDLLPGCFTH